MSTQTHHNASRSRPHQGVFFRLILPLLLMALFLLGFNAGLHTLLPARLDQFFLPLPVNLTFDDQATLEQWIVSGGTWQIDDGTLQQSETEQATYAIFIRATTRDDGSYRIATTAALDEPATEAALLFNGQFPHMRGDHHIARVVVNRETGIVRASAGYKQGNIFTEQGSTPLPFTLAQAETIHLAVTYDQGAYTLWVDHEPALSDLPLFYSDGVVGLQVTGGAAHFDYLRIQASGS